MTYPSAPWHLNGKGFLTVNSLDIDRVRALIPAQLNIIPIFPGQTLGGVYVAQYGAGSTLEYNELIVVSGIVSYANRVGFWISHIYVDNPDSVAGGREIWGLPKQLARFNWDFQDQPQVEVYEDERHLCSLKCQWRSFGLQVPVGAPAFGMLDGNLLTFQAYGKINLNLTGIDLTIPSESSFAPLNIKQPLMSFYGSPLDVTIKSPSMI